jgi:hypothetical protein
VESGHRDQYPSRMVLNRTLYAVFVGLLGFSPVLSVILSDAFGYPIGDVDWIRFLWVGPALSLPATLAVARLARRERYSAYWDYLESFPGNSRKRTTAAWATLTMVMAVVGFALTR